MLLLGHMVILLHLYLRNILILILLSDDFEEVNPLLDDLHSLLLFDVLDESHFL